MSSEVYSVAGYHHEFNDIGYSMNFADFNTVPAAAYFFGCDGPDYADCYYHGSRYTSGIDFINGKSKSLQWVQAYMEF